MYRETWLEYWRKREELIREGLQERRKYGHAKKKLENPRPRDRSKRKTLYVPVIVTQGEKYTPGTGGMQHLLTLSSVVKDLLAPEERVKIGIVADGKDDYLEFKSP